MSGNEAGATTDGFKYRAFISYSHQDRKWGNWLHKAIERYRVPRRLVGAPGRDGPVPRKLFPVFRDREELPSSSDLSEQITEALKQSAYLIVVCSPNGARSRWVNEEIVTFKRLGRENRILPLIVDGEPNASDKPGFDPNLECFPPALKYHLGKDGKLTDQRVEPIAADARPQGDGRENAKLKLIAGMLGIDYDALKQRELEAARQRMIMRAAIAATVAFFVILTGLIRRDELIAQSDVLARQAQALSVGSGDNTDAMILTLEGLPAGHGLLLPRPERASAETALVTTWARNRLQEVLRGHSKALTQAWFSADGTRVVTASRDGTARIWDARTGKALAVLRGHRSSVNTAVFSPNGFLVVTASDDGSARIWNALTGAQIGRPLGSEGAVNMAAFSPDGARIVTASRDGTARIWDSKTGTLRQTLAEPDQRSYVYTAIFSPDSRLVLTGSYAGIARLWNPETGAPAGAPMIVRTMDLPRGDIVVAAVFSPDGSRLALATAHGAMQFWNTATAEPFGAMMMHKGAVYSAMFSSDGTRLLTASQDGTARLWDAQTGEPAGSPMQHGTGVYYAAFSRDGTRIVTASADGAARIWDGMTGQALGFALRHDKGVTTAQFSPDGTRIVTASLDGTARIWDAISGLPLPGHMKHAARINSIAYGAGGTRLVTSSEDDTAIVWNTATGGKVAVIHDETCNHPSFKFPLSGCRFYSAAFSPDGAHVVTASEDGKAQIWDALKGSPQGRPIRLTGHIYGAQFSPDGKRLVTAGEDGTARQWNAMTGKRIGPVMSHLAPVYSAAYSRDGRQIVTASQDGTARIWNAATGVQIGPSLQNGSDVNAVALNSNGSRLAAGMEDGRARIWNIAACENETCPSMTISGHERPVEAIAFSPDGTEVATASLDGTVRVWDAATGHELALTRDSSCHAEETCSATAVAFSPDRDRPLIAAAFADGTVQIFHAPKSPAQARGYKLVEQACMALSRMHYTDAPPGIRRAAFLPPYSPGPCNHSGLLSGRYYGHLLSAGGRWITQAFTASEARRSRGGRVQTHGTVTINFDDLDASAGYVRGAPVVQYLARYGVRVTDRVSEADRATLNVGLSTLETGFVAASAPNVFGIVDGHGPVSYTLRFAAPLSSFSLTRVMLVGGPNGITHPQWSITAFDGAHRQIGDSLGEDEIRIFNTTPARTFKIKAPLGKTITEVTITADGRYFDAFSSAVFDNFQLTYAQ